MNTNQGGSACPQADDSESDANALGTTRSQLVSIRIHSWLKHDLPGLSDSIAGVSESPAKCRHCGATTRLGNGLCLSCTLREGLRG